MKMEVEAAVELALKVHKARREFKVRSAHKVQKVTLVRKA